ncbi:MAG: hypothetical protein V1899_03975 [Planctomycetota bacterium]
MEGPERQRAFDDLAAYYQNAKNIPNYAAALNDLKATGTATRKKAGRYLLGLLAQPTFRIHNVQKIYFVRI